MQFGPLSPQSSRTLLRLRETRSRSRDNVDRDTGGDDDEPRRDILIADDHDADSAAAPAVVSRRRFRKRRRNSDPSSNRPLVTRHRDGLVESARSSASPSEGEDEIEVLPDRFDSQGQPLYDGHQRRRSGEWTERHGDFAYRSSTRGAPQVVRGSWGVAGTDPEHVERVMRDVSGVLMSAGEMPRGLGGWLGLAGRLLEGVVAPPPPGEEEEEERDRDRRRGGGGGGHARGGSARVERGVIGYGDGGSENSRDERGKGRRRVDDHGYDEEEEQGNYYDDEEREDARRRRRRRRRRREADE